MGAAVRDLCHLRVSLLCGSQVKSWDTSGWEAERFLAKARAGRPFLPAL